MRLLIFGFLLLSFNSCNMGGNRFPANERVYVETDEPVAFAQIKLSSIERGLKEVIGNSAMIKSLDRFEMDPATRILNVRLTVDYPLESLFNFTKVPENNLSNLHDIELSVSFPETKTLAHTRYLGLTFHKFKIDGDDYIDAFEIVTAVMQTLLANSELVDYLYKKHSDNLPQDDYRVILQEILDENGIVVFHTTRKINFKLDLGMIAHLSPYVADYENLRLWRFSPTLFNGEEVRFKIIAGEGKPADTWLQSQQARITEDRRTLLQVRTDLYQEFSDVQNIEINNQNYLNLLLANESINTQTLPKNYQREIQGVLRELSQEAQEVLSRQNDNFIADPEYEYVQFNDYSQNRLRLFISDIDRRLTIDASILNGGDKNSNKKPLVTKMVSQNLLNKGMNFLVDLELEGNQLFTEAEFWLMPQLPGVGLKGKIHLPIEYLLGLMDKNLIGQDYESQITDGETGFPVELILESKMADNGVLGLDIKKFTIKSGERKIEIDRTSSNKTFLIDLTKMYLANSLSALKFESEDPEDEEEAQREEARQILSYLTELKNEYSRITQREINEVILKDLLFNPFNTAGEEHLNRKKEILLGQLFSYNEQTKLFEMRLDPDIVVDKINNVRHNLQVWSLTPLYSKELNNTFLEMSVGKGLRPQKYIDELYFRGGQAENSQFSGIYYELGNERSTVDLLFSMNFKYLKHYINSFLAEMVKYNENSIMERAEAEKGEAFYEIEHLDIDISSDKKIMLDLKIKSAKYARTFRRLWLGRELKVDSYSISAQLLLQSKMIDLGANNQLSNLKYHPQAISVVPTQVKIKSGSPSLINRALTSLAYRGANLLLNNGTFKKLLLKIVNKSLTKMYADNSKAMMGHPIEKIARLQTTSQDLLIFLNPKLAGQAFDVHLTSHEDRLEKAIKLDSVNQMMHVAMTSGSAMAKQDKKDLLEIVKQTNELLSPILATNSAEDLQDLLKDQQLVGKLITNSDIEKMSVYNKLVKLMSKYDQVLHTASIPHQNKLERTRISASGSELMYFAGVSFKIYKNLDLLLAKMRKYNLNSQNMYYPTFEEARNKLKNNIYAPLKAEYQQKNHRINRTILDNKVSFWTYQVYPDSYLAEEVYNLIKNP